MNYSVYICWVSPIYIYICTGSHLYIYRVFQKELYNFENLCVFCYILTVQNVVYVLCINFYKLSKF
jgi:hypothetical protein